MHLYYLQLLVTYNRAPVDPNDEVKPWVQGNLRIIIPEHLEAIRALCCGVLVLWRGVKPGDEAVQGAKHSRHDVRSLGNVMCIEVRSQVLRLVWSLGQSRHGPSSY